MPNKIYLTFWIAVAYIAGAQVGLSLALLPGIDITLLWPPSGIALAVVLLWGNHAVPGLVLGAFLTFLHSIHLAATGTPVYSAWAVLGTASILTASETLGPLVAARLLRRYAPSAPIWGSAADILRGVICIALACCVPTFIGVLVASNYGYLSLDLIMTSLGMWWLGEFCGMLIFTPIAFAVARRIVRPGKFWRRLRPETMPSATVIYITLVAVALASFYILWTREGQGIAQSLEREASIAARDFNYSLRAAERDLDSIRALMYSSGLVDADEFQRYATAEFAHRWDFPGAQAIGWAPRVTDPRAWELQMLAAGEENIVLFETGADGSRVPVTRRPDYFPVQFIYPPDGTNLKAVGFDLGSETYRRKALERARDTGKVGMMAPIYLVQASNRVPGMLIGSAVYQRDVDLSTIADRRKNLVGFATGVYFIGSVFNQATVHIKSDIDLHLIDDTLPREEQWYHLRPSSEPHNSYFYGAAPTLASLTDGYSGTAVVSFAGHEWLVIATPGENYISSHRTWAPWGALLLLLLLAIGLASFMIERVSAARQLDAERVKTLKALHDARVANENKSYFMAAASHDIKQPLYALGILTDTLLMSDPPENNRPIISSLKQSIAEMSRHFDTLMDVGRFQEGGFTATIYSFSLAELERRIDLEIRPLCEDKGLTWTIHMDDVQVNSDPELLLRLVRNLLANAVRYTDEGEVSCTSRTVDDHVEIRIADTGSGLSIDQQRLVLRGVSESSGDFFHTSGLGLGLSIVNNISMALDLDLEVSTDEEQGTTFTFWLPITRNVNGSVPSPVDQE